MANEVQAVKRFKVRAGYSWVDQKGRATGHTEVTNLDPNFKGQEYKLEPLKEKPKKDKKDENKPKGSTSPQNRMGDSAEGR